MVLRSAEKGIEIAIGIGGARKLRKRDGPLRKVFKDEIVERGVFDQFECRFDPVAGKPCTGT